MKIQLEQSALLMIDMQERLLTHVHGWQAVLRQVKRLVEVAQRLGVPVLGSEQYPRGIGPTEASLRALLSATALAEKLHFSCVTAGCLESMPGYERPQWVLCGIEAHVCVLQTALDALALGRQVFVVQDAISSRASSDQRAALRRLERAGAQIVTAEMVIFEWLGAAGSDVFRDISRHYLR